RPGAGADPRPAASAAGTGAGAAGATAGVKRTNAHRPEIDGLRSLAVLWVVFFHASPQRLPSGYIGVDVFFVISGYLISGILFREMRDGSYTLADFYFRRCRRILPALTVVLLTTWAIGWFVLASNDFASLGRHVAASSLFISNILLWSEAGYFDTSAELKPLLHFWSLGVEEQFYVFWPLILMAFFAMRRAGAVTLAIALLFGASFLINIGGLQTYPSATFYLLPSRFWELLTGAAIAWYEFRRPGRQIGAPLMGGNAALAAELTGAIGLGLILAATALITALTPFPGWYALMPVLGSAMLIHAGQGSWLNRRIFSLRPLVLIGLISYPLYLWHWPLLSFLHIVQGPDEGGASMRMLKYGLVALSFVLAWLTWQFVEKPMQRLAGRMRRDGRREQRALAVSALVIALLGLGGWATWRADGIPTRFPESADLRAFHYDPAADYREGDCFLRYTQQASEFGEHCLPKPAAAAGRPQIVLWGDSHAAHLALGLRERSAALGADFAQITASACPPLQNFMRGIRPFCPGVVELAIERIRAARPAVVVVSSAWYGIDAESVQRELPRTVRLLKDAGAGQVIVVGPFPEWQPSLPRALQSYYRSHQQLPERTQFGLKATLPELDRTIRGFLGDAPARYVSPREFFCDPQGCLTGVTASGFALMSYDTSHLTDTGSRWFVDHALVPALSEALKQ
ncbi:MAG: acyltransferase family protein, partial [Burkholderiaceae bacterium]